MLQNVQSVTKFYKMYKKLQNVERKETKMTFSGQRLYNRNFSPIFKLKQRCQANVFKIETMNLTDEIIFVSAALF